MAEQCGADVPEDVDEHSRDDRIECYYQAWGAREMAERIVELEDELGADIDGVCTGMHADVAEAWAEIERLRREVSRYESAWKSAHCRAKHLRGAWNASRHAIAAWRRMCQGQTEAMRELITVLSERREERDRYRLAWLSARRRAADEANYAMEALELKRQEVARLTFLFRHAQERADNLSTALDEARKTTHGPRLECVGPDGEGGEVWRAVDDSKKP